MVTVQYRRWCPPQSPLRIEFPPELLHHVRLESNEPVRGVALRWIPRLNRVVNQSSGLLYGLRQGDEVRVLEARAHDGAAPGGLEPVGTFVCRARGEVFLTDDDLAAFEQHQGALALVVAGGRAGFFVRELDGSVQAIRSHEEFKVADAASRPSVPSVAADELPALAPRWSHSWRRLAACAAILAVPAGAFAYLRPLLQGMPIALTIREEAGQLVMGWNAGTLAESGRLEIHDGAEQAIVLLPPGTSSATYRPEGRDVEVRLSTGTRAGSARWEQARFATSASPASAEFRSLRERIDALTLEAGELRRLWAEGQARSKELAAQMSAATRER